jgi:hypothetical protein
VNKGNITIAKSGGYCGDMELEYAPKGTCTELSALKSLVREMAETLLFYSERGGGRARDLYRHPLTQRVLDEVGYYEVYVKKE